jgi:hypothetical protein
VKGGGKRGQGSISFFWNLTLFFYFKFKNTFNLIFPGFKMPSERFLFKNFKTGLTFWHRWFFNFQNLVQSCQHIGGTPCISTENWWKPHNASCYQNVLWYENLLLYKCKISCFESFQKKFIGSRGFYVMCWLLTKYDKYKY